MSGNEKQRHWLMEAEVFYRCPECGESHVTKYLNPDSLSSRIEGVIAYLCSKCGRGVVVVQTRVKALEVSDEGA